MAQPCPPEKIHPIFPRETTIDRISKTCHVSTGRHQSFQVCWLRISAIFQITIVYDCQWQKFPGRRPVKENICWQRLMQGILEDLDTRTPHQNSHTSTSNTISSIYYIHGRTFQRVWSLHEIFSQAPLQDLGQYLRRRASKRISLGRQRINEDLYVGTSLRASQELAHKHPRTCTRSWPGLNTSASLNSYARSSQKDLWESAKISAGPRHSESDPTRTKWQEGCASDIIICSAPQREWYNTKWREGRAGGFKTSNAKQQWTSQFQYDLQHLLHKVFRDCACQRLKLRRPKHGAHATQNDLSIAVCGASHILALRPTPVPTLHADEEVSDVLWVPATQKATSLLCPREAILRDILQKWKVECRADGLVPMRFAIFPLHLSKVLRLPRKSEARSYEVLHLSRKIIFPKLKIWCSKTQPLSGNQPLTSEQLWWTLLTSKCASHHNGVHFFDITASKSGPNMVCFVHFDLETCFAPQRRALFHHLNFQKWSEPGVLCTFWLGTVLRATTACTFSTSQLPNVVRTWCALYILTWKRASRHNGVQFFISHLAS